MSHSWKTVRVFISSTFIDMHAERNYLVKVVFPELRERMACQCLHLVDIDLRWGIPQAEAESGGILEVCLEEIERSRPFFIGILGERYGSIIDTMPEDVCFSHPWLKHYSGYSFTALEIIHGVLHKPELARRSFFYFRDPAVLTAIPKPIRDRYAPDRTRFAARLKTLKGRIRHSGRPVMENYPCRWDESTGGLVGLEIFGRQVLEDLWTAICAEYPQASHESDPVAAERLMHETFVEEKAHFYTGREEKAAQLNQYLQVQDHCPIVVTGEAGSGKSAFLANWYRNYSAAHPEVRVLAYFIGASPASSNHHHLLRAICEELIREFSLPREIAMKDQELSRFLTDLLHSASQNGTKIILLLDGLDQLIPMEAAHGLGWLLDYIPENVYLLVSTVEGESLEILRHRQAWEIALSPLTAADQELIVQSVLAEWGRRLDQEQLAALLAHPAVGNPLYLRVSLEELRLFGSFDQLMTRIRALPADITGLFEQVLSRLEEDHGAEFVKETFSLLAHSRFGLSETELLVLLQAGEIPLPRAIWARLRRGAGSYLVQRGELFGYFHRQLGEAVDRRYPRSEKIHSRLAVFFAVAPIERKLDEYPWQLHEALEKDTLAKTLSDPYFLQYAWEHDREYEWIGFWNSLRGHSEPAACYRSAITQKETVIGTEDALASYLNIVGQLLCDMGNYAQAVYFHKRALDIWEKALGPNHLEVADTLYHLGQAYQRQDQKARSTSCYRRAMAIYEKDSTTSPLKIADCLDGLADVQFSSDQCLSYARHALAIRENFLGSDHSSITRSLATIITEYHFLRRYKEALPLAKRGLEIAERTMGPGSLTAAQFHGWLASAISGAKKIKESRDEILSHSRRCLAIHENLLGPNHPDTGKSAYSLATFLDKMEHRSKEALPYYEQGINAQSGTQVFASIIGLNDLALCYLKQFKLFKALRLLPKFLRSIWMGILRSVPRLIEHPSLMFGIGLLLSIGCAVDLFLHINLVDRLPYKISDILGFTAGLLCLTQFWKLVHSGTVVWGDFIVDNLFFLAAFLIPLGRGGLQNPTYLIPMMFGGGGSYFRWPSILWLYGITLLLPATVNLAGGQFDLWSVWGCIQLLLALFLVVRYWKRT